jgi:hypothetical protein
MPATTHSIRPIFSAFRHEIAERKEARARRRRLWADFAAYKTPNERLELDTLLSQLSAEELDELLAGRA